MGRHGIRLEDVEKAIRKLHTEGRNPTIDAIRDTIGSGSKSTINRHLHTLKTRAEQTPSPTNINKPLPSEVLNLVSALWEKLQSSDTQSDETKKTLSLPKQNEPTNMTEKYNTLQQAHDLVTRQLQVRTRVCNQLEEKMAAQQKLLTTCENELRQKNNYNQELTRRIRILASDLQQARIAIQHLQQQVSALENTKRALLAERQHKPQNTTPQK